MDRHHLRASLNTARKASQRLGKQTVDQAKQQVANAGVDVESLEDGARKKRAVTSELAERAAERVVRDPMGQRFRESSESVGRRLAAVPGLTVPSDFVQARYDLRGNADRLRSDPHSIDDLIWTATALRHIEAGLARYRKVKVVGVGAHLLSGDLGSAALKVTAHLAGRLAGGDAPPPAESLLKAAFVLSIGRIRANLFDAHAHYGLARVYLLTGHYLPAALAAQIAIRTSNNAVLIGDSLTALAYAKLAADDRDEARRSAHLAIDHGVSTAHLVLAELTESDGSMATLERADRAARHRRAVANDDYERFFGQRPSMTAIAGAVLQAQKAKSRTLLDGARAALDEQSAKIQNRPVPLEDLPPPNPAERSAG